MGKIKSIKKRSPGRPKKRKMICPKSGRKKVPINKASKRTIHRRASDLVKLSENNSTVMQLALRLSKDKEVIEAQTENKESKGNVTNIVRHSKDSALNFYLEHNLSKRS